MNVKETFNFDFKKFGTKLTQNLPIIDYDSKFVVDVEVCLHYDFESNTKFLALYMPTCPNPLNLIFYILREPKPENIIPISSQFYAGEISKDNTLKKNWASEAVFSKRIFIYGEFELSEEELDKLENFSDKKNVSVKFRGIDYAQSREKTIMPLAFISHDSRDKKLIARPLTEELRKRGCPVWYDEFSLKVGDSLRESIEKGIKECRKCIIVLSKHFLANTGWTKYEFNSIITKEFIEGKNVILPVWDKVIPKDVYEYCPVLADRFGLNWSKGRVEVSRQLYNAIMGND